MDTLRNPFSPGAGCPPPELVGRDPLLEQARILLGRIRLRRPEKSILFTGLRGVGKTVLLGEIERMAKKAVTIRFPLKQMKHADLLCHLFHNFTHCYLIWIA